MTLERQYQAIRSTFRHDRRVPAYPYLRLLTLFAKLAVAK